MTFDVPQVRGSNFYPQALEKGLRSERALKLALAEMYIQGVSTRRVAAITEKLIGTEVTASQVSRATAELDQQVASLAPTAVGTLQVSMVDARYEKVRVDGLVRDTAVLIATGLDMAGKREVLGVSNTLSEAEVHWRTFLQSLTQRGLTGVELITSDDHAGLENARKAIFGGVPWQRCQFHLQQNAQSHVPRRALKSEAAADIRAVFNARQRQEAEALLAQTVQKYEKPASDSGSLDGGQHP